MGMWHVTQVILLLGLFLKGVTQSGGGQGGTYKVRGRGKSMLPVESYLVWEGGLHGMIAGLVSEG